MEILFQIPVVDLRGIVTQDTGRRSRPRWPTGKVSVRPGESEFVPGFGALRNTPGSQTGGWGARAQNVNAARAVRLPSGFGRYYCRSTRAAQLSPRSRSNLQSMVISRSFYGSVIAPRAFAEFRVHLTPDEGQLQWEDIVDITTLSLTLPARIAQSKEERAFAELGPTLAAYFRRNTTRNTQHQVLPAWLVASANPLVVVTSPHRPIGKVPRLFDTPVGSGTDVDTIVLYSRRSGVDCWFVAEPDSMLRQRKQLHLSRLHSERMTFEVLTRAIGFSSRKDPRYNLDAESRQVQLAIQSCAEYLSKKIAYGQNQAALLEIVDADLVMHEAEWDAVRSSFNQLPEGLRILAQQAMEKIVVNGAFVMGDKFDNVTGSTIINRSAVVSSFNQLAGDEDLELRKALMEIAKAVEAVGDKDAADLTESLIEEFAGARRKPVLRTLWDSLKSAAPVVSSLTAAYTLVSKLAGAV